MLKNFILISTLLLTYFMSSSAYGQSAWTQAQNKGYFKLNQSAIVSGYFYNLEGEVIEITTTSVYISSLYGEYGLTDRITAIAYVPFFVRSTINKRESTVNGGVLPGDELNGIGDPIIGVKYGILNQGPVLLAADLLLGIPLGKNVGGDTELLQTGDGEFNQQIRLIGSSNFGKVYTSLFVGYNHRTTADFDYASGRTENANFSDEFHVGGEIGWMPSKSWLLNLKLYVVEPLEEESANMGMATSIFGNNVGYFSITPEVNYFINEHFGISASSGLALAGQNILASPNFGLGLFYIP